MICSILKLLHQALINLNKSMEILNFFINTQIIAQSFYTIFQIFAFFKYQQSLRKMQVDKIITIVLGLFICVVLYLIFSRTNANPLMFLLGGFVCLVVQIVLIFVFCLYKLQQTYRQAHSIRLKRNSNLDPENQCPFESIAPVQQFYFNKYTEQSKIFNKKNQMKSIQTTNKDEFYFQEFQINEPRKQIIEFLKEIQGYYNTLNIFTDVLVNFGQDLKYIEKSSVFSINKFQFAEFQRMYPPQIPISELTPKETSVFKQTNTKLLRAKGEEKLLFPSWCVVVDLIKYIGIQFQKIEAMRRSNSQMLTMIHKKVLQEFELLQKKVITIGQQLNQSLKNMKQLQKDYAKYQNVEFNIEDTNQPHLEMMSWFKKQYYAFRDLQRRIKQNENKIKEKTSNKKFYQQKLSYFRSNSQKTFMKTVKTRYVALLDSYHITVEDSIKKIQQSFHNNAYTPVKRPKVKNIVISKNLNEALAAQKQYQKEYFQRVQYFQNILKGLMNSLDSVGQFLTNLGGVFGEMIKNLKSCQENKEKIARYFTTLTKKVLQRALSIYSQLNQLVQINEKMKSINKPQLQQIQKQIKTNVLKSYKILNQIDINSGPIQYKYHSARCQIQTIYQEIQKKIAHIQQFQQVYILHSGRIKKIILTEFIDFLNFQKKLISIGSINNVTSRQKQIEQMIGEQGRANQNEQLNSEQKQNEQEIQGEGLQKQNGHLSTTYLKLINQFLFVSYTQWKISNYFKSKLLEELFIAFNKDPNESFSKIQVSQLQFSGLPPQIIWLKQLNTEEKEVFFDAQLAFPGKIKFKVNTIYKLFRDFKVQINIEIQDFFCVLRFCFVPASIGWGWFSFIGEPISKFHIVPSIGNYRIQLETLRTIFNNFLLNKLKKNTYPIKQKIPIPASKKDEDLMIILKRFKALEQITNLK